MAGKYIDNGPDLPAAKNKLIRREGHIEMVLNGAGGSIKLDEGSLAKVIDSSWSVANGKSNSYVSATLLGCRVAMHRLFLDMVDRPEVKLEFVNGDRFDLRLKNIQPKSLGNIQRSAEQAHAEIATKLKKAAGLLNDTEVRTEIKQMAMNQAADMLAVLVSIANNTEARSGDRITAANSVLNRGVGPVGDDPITGAMLPRIEISFAQPRVEKPIVEEDGGETARLNNYRLEPTFG